jgi:hypothetical protein
VNGPVLFARPSTGHVAGAHAHGEVAIDERIFEKIVLNRFALISKGNHKLLKAVMCISLEDVPKNRAAADFDHRLRFDLGLF